ncbi:hypothetical protein GOODEAATRI_031978 [Goodea atripinnis]|uniref:Ig-like domain-containing protein n=1 Tax=Goodea atripinnis TaxID=208336 RepID=A0ABV0N5X7_9TELE
MTVKRITIHSASALAMFSVILLLLLAAGSCVKCEQLTQPASVTVQPGQSLTISCQVSYSLSSYYTAWVRQPVGKGLEWIGCDKQEQMHSCFPSGLIEDSVHKQLEPGRRRQIVYILFT